MCCELVLKINFSIPRRDRIKKTFSERTERIQLKMGYNEEFKESINNPEKFWRKKAEFINWYKFPEKILSKDENGFFRWYQGGKLNTSFFIS